MTSSAICIKAYRFGAFRFLTSGRILERDGRRIRVTPKVADMLHVFLENAGHLVTKEQLLEQVWPNLFIVDSGITRNISVLRKALEGGLAAGSALETIPRRGYRLLAEVSIEGVGRQEIGAARAPWFLPWSSTATLG